LIVNIGEHRIYYLRVLRTIVFSFGNEIKPYKSNIAKVVFSINYIIIRQKLWWILTNRFIAIRFPRRWFPGGHVKLIVEQWKSFFARQSVPREQRTVSDGKLDFDVNEIGQTALNERRPHPIVDVLLGDIAHDVRPPVDALFKIYVAFFDPLEMHKN